MKGFRELYRFVEGDSGNVFTYTSADTPYTYAGEVYVPVPVGRDEVENKGEMTRENVTISLSIDFTMAKKWFVMSLDFPLTVSIFSVENDVVEIEWKGRLASVAPKKSVIDFVFESVFTSMRRMGLRQRYQITCPHSLYGRGCNLNKESFATVAGVTAANNAVLTIPGAAAFDDGFFASGMFEDHNGNLRFITSHVGETITLIRPMNSVIAEGIENGFPINCRLFPGCDRRNTTCNSRFNNLNNFGGFPFIPGKNPFDGSIV